VSVKKAKGKGKSTAKKAAAKKKPAPAAKKNADMERVRENINTLVKNSARKIATEVIKAARTGQLASARYLFEAVGLYPASEQSEARPLETTMAHQLLTRMGIPLEPVVQDEDGEVVETKTAPAGSKPVAAVHEELAERDGEEDPLPENEE
jgi:hypothetical protein